MFSIDAKTDATPCLIDLWFIKPHFITKEINKLKDFLNKKGVSVRL